MKKTTTISGKLSLAVILLFIAATTASAKTPKSVASLFSKQINMGVYNPENANEWRLVAMPQQKLRVQQVTGQALAASIAIKNSHGDVIYTGILKDGAGDINIGGMENGKYGVYIHNQNTDKIYKLLIE